MNITEIIERPEYSFIKTNPHLKCIAFLTFGGSHAYGTNIEGSDIDVRGCALNSPSDILGLSNFEQFTDNATDTTIYSFNKLISLLMNCNPNVIEMLGARPEHYALVSGIGRQLLDNRKMFLSMRAVKSFGGYANQQLRRLENALARDNYPQPEKERHILGSCESAMLSFGERYEDFEEGSINLSIGPARNEEMESEIFVDINLHGYPLRDYKNIMADLHNIVEDYSKLNKRNNKKDDAHLAKHSMHLIRLYLMCIDILEKEEIVTYRESDHDLLMSIRRGDYLDGGRIRPEFTEILAGLEGRLEYAKANSSLPERPDYAKINEFVMSVNYMVVDTLYCG